MPLKQNGNFSEYSPASCSCVIIGSRVAVAAFVSLEIIKVAERVNPQLAEIRGKPATTQR